MVNSSLDFKNVLLTGANGSLGKDIKLNLENSGFKVYTHTRSDHAESDICCDLTSVRDLSNIKDFILKSKIDILVNNAGIYSCNKVENIEDGALIDLINTNLIAPILISKFFYSQCLKENKKGLIVNINSLAAKNPNFLESIYCTSKAGLSSFSSCLSLNSRESGVKVIDIFSGAFKSKITLNRSNYSGLMDSKSVSDMVCHLIKNAENCFVSSIEVRNK